MSDYITSSALKATLTLSGTSFADDDITAAITAASRALDNLCQRRFYADTDAMSVRHYSPEDPGLLEIDDLVTLTTLKSADDGSTTFANTWTENVDFVLEPLNATSDADDWPWTHIRVHPLGSFLFNTRYPRSVEVTGKFGWAAVPGPIVDATTMLATRLLKMKREAPLGVLAFQEVAVRVSRTDPNIGILAGPYMKHRAAVA